MLAFAALMPACSGGGGGGDSKPYLGSWSLFEYNGQSVSGAIITINADGTGTFYIADYNQTIACTYTVSGSSYAIYYNGELVETGTWSVAGDILTLRASDGDYCRYQRV
jgi:hypothetical protein